MPFATVQEAEARISELEVENKNLVRETMSHKKGYKEIAAFLESKGFDVKSDLEDQWSTSAGKSQSDVQQLTAKIDKLTKGMERLQLEKEELTQKQEETVIKNNVTGLMKDVIGNEDLIELWIAKKKIKIVDGKTYYSDGSVELPVDKFVEKYKKDHPERVSVKQTDGGSSHKADTQTQNKTETKQMTDSDFSKLTRKAQDEFVLAGGEITQ